MRGKRCGPWIGICTSAVRIGHASHRSVRPAAPPQPPPEPTRSIRLRQPIHRSPKTEVTDPKKVPKPPSSASHETVAEDGSKQDDSTPPSLRHRRPKTGIAEDGSYTPRKWVPNLRIRRPMNYSPNTEATTPEKDSQTPDFGDSWPAPQAMRGLYTRQCPPASSQCASSADSSPYSGCNYARQSSHPDCIHDTRAFRLRFPRNTSRRSR